MARKPYIPEGYAEVTPYLLNDNAAAVIDFLVEVFGATVIERSDREDGSLLHADIAVGDARLMIGNATSEYPAMPATFYLYVDDVDAAYERALRAGGTSILEPRDMDYGDRNGGVGDPGGNVWWVSTPLKHLKATSNSNGT